MNVVWKTRMITETVKTFELVEQILTFLLLTYTCDFTHVAGNTLAFAEGDTF